MRLSAFIWSWIEWSHCRARLSHIIEQLNAVIFRQVHPIFSMDLAEWEFWISLLALFKRWILIIEIKHVHITWVELSGLNIITIK